MKKMRIPPETELYIGRNLHIPIASNRRAVLVADAAVKDLYAVDLAHKIQAELLTIPRGEKAKSAATAAFLMEELFKMGCGRDTVLIALGGGVTTDLVGYVASVYMRGIPLILVPTTLLAIVDAAIGGKTAIDTAFGKNLIGTFYPPQAIVADLERLDTLPEKEWLNGRAEILKMGLISEPVILKMDEEDRILKAIEAKIAIVARDPTEKGLRRILNFGHTMAHALEAISHYEMSHGEAVALGCLVEAHLSMQLGYLTPNDFKTIQTLYSGFSLQLPKTYDRAKLLSAMTHDKKKATGYIRFVLIDRIGHALPFDGEYCRAVTQTELEPTLNWMENWK
jgi:3-dehydroquinate synthase